MSSTSIKGFPFDHIQVTALASKYAKKIEDDGVLLAAEFDEGKITEKEFTEAYFQLMLGIVGLNSLMLFAKRNYTQFVELVSDFPKHSPKKISFTWLKISGMMRQEHQEILKRVYAQLEIEKITGVPSGIIVKP